MDSTTVRFVSGLLAFLFLVACIVPIAIFVKYLVEHKSSPPGSVGFLRGEAYRCMAAIRALDSAERELLLTPLNTEFAALFGRVSESDEVEELRKHVALVANQRQSLGAEALRRSATPGSDPSFAAIRLYELTASALLLYSESGDISAKNLADEVMGFVQAGL